MTEGNAEFRLRRSGLPAAKSAGKKDAKDAATDPAKSAAIDSAKTSAAIDPDRHR
jgi:hypothetical protein